MKLRFIVTLILLNLTSYFSFGQFGYAAEYGFFVGGFSLQSDYGAREEFSSSYANMGYTIGGFYYLNFAYSSNYNYSSSGYFGDHFKLRAELSFSKTDLQHYGKYVDGSKNSVMARQLRAMHGTTSIADLGLQLEYFPTSIRDFTSSIGVLRPYFTGGIHGDYYIPKVESDLGNINTPLTTPEKYFGGLSNATNFTYSLSFGGGLRYRLNEAIDLFLDARYQYFFTDWIDGVSPNSILYPENKSNDTLVLLNFGYVYYFE
ncbi:MAG: glutamate dehydrogenase [Flavobacterium sp. BFFFF2]|nr:MAG: glutamate dehydrogenase [Flavobacterium sp. BFFFF2]